jgi:hypothetical protein
MNPFKKCRKYHLMKIYDKGLRICQYCGWIFGEKVEYLDFERHLDTHIYKDMWEEIE